CPRAGGRSRTGTRPDRPRPESRSPRRTRPGCASPATGPRAPRRLPTRGRADAGPPSPQAPGLRAVATVPSGSTRVKSAKRALPCRPSSSPAFEVAAQGAGGPLDLGDRDVLIRFVGEQRIARSEVHRRHAEGAEPRDVGPAELRGRREPQCVDELLGDRTVEARAGAFGRIGDDEVKSGEEFAQELF